ncbi:hypothetical protein H0H81_002244, partial [Sphagnurus paluster]
IGESQKKKKTVEKLKTIFTTAATVGGKTQAKKLNTESGIKDMNQGHFTDMICNFVKGLRGGSIKQKQDRVDDLLKTLADNLTSPIWRIQEGIKI